MNELFERLRKSTTANDVQEALASLSSIQDPTERAKASSETITLIEKYARELLERGQYKNAAYQYFSGAQLIQRFLSDPNSENQWLRASADALAKASQEHISWDDLLGGAACMTIASLLKIQTGDWNVNEHLDAFIKSHDRHYFKGRMAESIFSGRSHHRLGADSSFFQGLSRGRGLGDLRT